MADETPDAAPTPDTTPNPDTGDTPDAVDSAAPTTVAGLRLPVAGALAVVIALLAGFLAGWIVKPDEQAGGPNNYDTVDVEFAWDMIAHHQQAVTMAKIEELGGTDPNVTTLAWDIISTQLNQIGRMEGYLTQWDMPTNRPDDRYMGWMKMDGHDMTVASPLEMTGMASSADLNKLRSLPPAEMDVFFVQLMLRHHQGGLHMLEYEYEHGDFLPLRDLAQGMLNTQTTEVAALQEYLASKNAPELPVE